MDVLLVEDHGLVRLGVRRLLEDVGRFGAIRECATLADALTAAFEHAGHVGLVLLDLGLPDAAGFEALERLRAALPAAPVLVVSGEDGQSAIDRAFAAGAVGYVPKSSSGPALRLAIEAALQGERYVPPHLLSCLRAGGSAADALVWRQHASEAAPAAAADRADLTPRQREVLALLALGYANKDIAEHLQLSVSTVRIHVSAILARLGLCNRTQAATSPAARSILARRS